MGFAVAPAARLYHIPVIHTFHIVTFYDQNQAALRRKSELWLAKKSRFRGITAPNNYDVSKLREAGLSQTKLLSNGVDVDFWHAKKPARPEPFRFVAVGRLEQQKGYEFLIAATARLAAITAAPFEVFIIGSGSQKAALQASAKKLGIEHLITFLGRQDPVAIKAIFAQAGAVVLPSLYETTPLTLLEAWAAGTAVITTPVGILRDTPPRFSAAQIVQPQDEFALASAMDYILANPLARQKLAVSGLQEVRQYAWPEINARLESLYRSIL
jgi:glycosyltransferase involved in cell wall biosynthesis